MILVFGSAGQVATELKEVLPDAVFLGRDRLDLARAGGISETIRKIAPAGIINAAAYTAVDKAEDDQDVARRINADAPAAMAHAAAASGIPIIQLSTDYVFDGHGDEAFLPDAPTGPLGAYGRTKLLGEQGIRNSGAIHAILRTSWVFSAHGSNFLKTMLRLSETRRELTIVGDQIGGPTPAASIAFAAVKILEALQREPAKSGTYHFAGAPDVSWAGFARDIFRQAGREIRIADIPTSDYPTPAKRPANSRLNCSSLAAFGLERPDWREGVSDALKKLGVIS